MGGVTVVLDGVTFRGVGQAVPEAHLLHDIRLGQLLVCLEARGLGEGLAAGLARPRHRHERVHLASHDVRDRAARVVAGRHGAAGGFDGGDGRGRGARHDDVDGLFEDGGDGGGFDLGLGLGLRRLGGDGAGAEQLHALLGLVDAARLGQLADRDGAGGIDSALVDPFLDAFEVHGREVNGVAVLMSVSSRFHLSSFIKTVKCNATGRLKQAAQGKVMRGIHIVESPFTMHHDVRRLTTRKPRGHFTVLLLTLVTSSGSLTLTGSGTTTSSDAFVIGSRVIGERGQDVSVAALLLLELREEERQRRSSHSGPRKGRCPLPL